MQKELKKGTGHYQSFLIGDDFEELPACSVEKLTVMLNGPSPTSVLAAIRQS